MSSHFLIQDIWTSKVKEEKAGESEEEEDGW